MAGDANVLRLFQHPNKTRVVLETDEQKTYEAFPLTNPRRYVLNIKDITVTPSISNVKSLVSPSDPVLASIRIAQFKKNVVRIVFDLKA